MNNLVTRLLELAESMIKGPRKKSAEEATPVQVTEAEPCEASEDDLYDHRIISVEEDAINRILKAQLRDHWLFYSVTFEFENNNKVYMGIITTLGTVINIEFTIEDLWFDDYASSFSVKLNMSDVDMGGFIMNTIVHLLGNWSLSLLGTFFNPFEIMDDGSTVRFEKKGIIRFDLSPNSPIRRLISWPNRCTGAKGPAILINARSEQSVLRLEYYAFRDEVETYNIPEVPVKTSWVRSIDMAAALLLPIGVWISFIILHHYLPTETIEFSFSTYFLISLGILCISFIVMNIPRYIYMYFDSRKKWQSVFVHNNIKIQMRKLQRRIQIQQVALKRNGKETDPESQANIRDLLLQIRDKRFLAQRLKIADEDRDRKQKIKFIIAYIVCTLLEWILLIH